MPHYYSQEQQAPSQPTEVEIGFRDRSYIFLTDRGVFSKGRLDYGTQTLLNAAVDEIAEPFLDLGCGYGAVGVIAGSVKGISVDMTDVNRRALELAKKNANRHRVEAEVFYSDGFAQNDRQYRTIFLNPPIRAGKEVVHRLFKESHEHLLPGGSLYIVIQKKQGLGSAKKYLLTLFKEVQTLERSAGYHVLKFTK